VYPSRSLSYVSPRILTLEDDADLAVLTSAVFTMVGFEAYRIRLLKIALGN
jgi:hypothetical protein